MLSAVSLTSSDVNKDSQFDRLSSVCICMPLVCVFIVKIFFPDFEKPDSKADTSSGIYGILSYVVRRVYEV